MKRFFCSVPMILFFTACGGGGGDGESDEGAIDPWTVKTPPIVNTAIEVPSQLDCEGGTALTYENFGKSFLQRNCTSCHSSELEGEARAGAPVGSDFDADPLTWRADMAKAVGAKDEKKMPPGVDLPTTDKTRFIEWTNCGAPGDFVE